GLGMFGAGTSWLYVALNTFGGMAAPLAAVGVAAFCLWLSLFPALAGYVAARWTAPGTGLRLVAAAAMWPLLEWARSWPIADFPWLSLGYASVVPSGATPLAGYAPLGGVWLASLAIALAAAALARIAQTLVREAARAAMAPLAVLAALFAGGQLLSQVTWTHDVGAPIAVSLVQGNVSQDTKFERSMRESTFALYTGLVHASRGRVVVLPESALPAFADEIPASVLRDLASLAASRDGMVLTGLFTVEPPEPGQRALRYYNSVVSLGAFEPQLYRKRHLVPFGESIPLEPIVGWFIRDVLSIPLANQSRGDALQPAFAIAGQRIAVDICYEDVFGADIRAQVPTATILVNVTNDAWYGHSLAAEQHNQIAAMRALESGRPLLRATNTGITSAIAADGRVIARLPWFTREILEVTVDGRTGETPYVRLGDAVAIVCALVLAAGAIALSARRRTAVPGEARQRAR
ncbi:MAG TPA: apolipoprotein N-acyltransferase, partial [Casimicrobiaceae bacterium]|nr:apolipoprotein N-acyltransferase [Casimicrobiaceae bacterium]